MHTDKFGNKYFKGNLHTHTTLSDGQKTPEECLRLYKDAGYDFIALTDHWYNGLAGDFEGMMILSGIEYDVYPGGCFHIVGYGMEKPPKVEENEEPKLIIDAIHSAGGLATLAHPAWSLTQPSSLAELTEVDCTEIYNSVSGYPYSARAYSGTIIDLAAVLGFRATLTAADDTHFYGGELFGGYVWVKAESLTRENILEAIKKGDCYGTQGPLISYGIENGYFVVRCEAGCKYVQFFTANYWQADTTATGGTVYEARFRLKSQDEFVRAEVCDFNGKFAYTQLISLK